MEITLRTEGENIVVTAQMYGGTDGWMRMEAHLPRADMTLTELQLRLVRNARLKLDILEAALTGAEIPSREP
jgi:O-acetylhomoserine/O-acetylserine sulfhydrylase-like pyridoxal-dependent enzyme